MPSFRSPAAQAQYVVRSLDLKSQGTERAYEQALTGFAEYLQENRLCDHLRDADTEMAISYLEARAEEVSQKTLDLDRQAIQALLGEKLGVVKSEIETVLSSRAYTHEQANIIASVQSERNALATEIALNAGLRAHELYTLRLADERPADTHREWRDDRFTGRSDVVIYTVEGKGGLCREVAIDKSLAERLEARRLDEPRTVYDRGIGYQSHYDIGGGAAWSSSFSKVSQGELGWSTGAHGLRHAFAQERMATLQESGYSYRDALEVVSQEMGHFRPEITETYLR